MRIVACTDFSEWSRAILPALQMFVDDADAEIHFVHVVDARQVHASESSHHDEGDVAAVRTEQTFAGGGSPSLPLQAREVPSGATVRAETRDQALQRATSEAQDTLARLVTGVSGRVTAQALVGHDVADTILDYAEQVDADLIALVTHAHRPIADVAFGGVTRKMIRDSKVPIVTVHPR